MITVYNQYNDVMKGKYMNRLSKIKIIADSSCDIKELSKVSFASAALKISTKEKKFIDDENLDIKDMVEYLLSYKGKSSSSCPNTNDWLSAFGDAREVYCVTITSNLSGSYNSAMLAKKKYEELYPQRQVLVIDSLSTGPEMALIVRKIEELVLQGMSYDDIEKEITNYTSETGLMFMLGSMQNLANNGRVSALTAKIAGVLGIRVVGRASDRGDLEILNKCRGERKALTTIVENLKDFGVKTGRIEIAHCINEDAALSLKSLINESIPESDVIIRKCGGLCSFYAEKGGLLIGYERF